VASASRPFGAAPPPIACTGMRLCRIRRSFSCTTAPRFTATPVAITSITAICASREAVGLKMSGSSGTLTSARRREVAREVAWASTCAPFVARSESPAGAEVRWRCVLRPTARSPGRSCESARATLSGSLVDRAGTSFAKAVSSRCGASGSSSPAARQPMRRANRTALPVAPSWCELQGRLGAVAHRARCKEPGAGVGRDSRRARLPQTETGATATGTRLRREDLQSSGG